MRHRISEALKLWLPHVIMYFNISDSVVAMISIYLPLFFLLLLTSFFVLDEQKESVKTTSVTLNDVRTFWCERILCHIAAIVAHKLGSLILSLPPPLWWQNEKHMRLFQIYVDVATELMCSLYVYAELLLREVKKNSVMWVHRIVCTWCAENKKKENRYA